MTRIFGFASPNARFQARRTAGARDERTLFAVACMRLFGGEGRCSGHLSVLFSLWACPLSLEGVSTCIPVLCLCTACVLNTVSVLGHQNTSVPCFIIGPKDKPALKSAHGSEELSRSWRGRLHPLRLDHGHRLLRAQEIDECLSPLGLLGARHDGRHKDNGVLEITR